MSSRIYSSVRRSSAVPGDIYVVLYEYETLKEGCLSLECGDELEYLGEKNGGWWRFRNQRTGEAGLAPSNFLEKKVQAPVLPPLPVNEPEYNEDDDYPSVDPQTANLELEQLTEDLSVTSVQTPTSRKSHEIYGYIENDYEYIGPQAANLQVKLTEDLSKESWYVGNMSCTEAYPLLLSPPNTVGSFLVRTLETSNGFALSVRREGDDILEYQINQDNNRHYFLKVSHKFRSLKELVEYYKDSKTSEVRLGFPYQPVEAGGEYPPVGPTRKAVLHSNLGSDSFWEIDRDSIILGRTLGRGHSAEVKQGRWINQLNVAVKVMKRGSTEDEGLWQEGKTMQKLRHPRLVKLYGMCTSPATEPVLIVTEFMAGGSILDHLLRRKQSRNLYSARELLIMGIQVASGMAYLEAEGIVHRDLAARNVLVDEGARNAKVADFGLARVLQGGIYKMHSLTKLPVKWTPPEVFVDFEFSSKTDMWSFGVFLFELFGHGTKPYGAMSNEESLSEVKAGYRLPKPYSCPTRLYSFMLSCWDEDSSQRPTFAGVKERMKELLKDL